MSEAIRATLEAALNQHQDLCVLRETFDGIGGSSAKLEEIFGHDRIITLPVADRAALATGVGIAIAGKRVVVELSSTARLAAAAEALTEAGSISQHSEFGVSLVVRVPYGHQGHSAIDRAAGDLLAAIPGIRVVCPSSVTNACGLLKAAINSGSPTVLLEPRELYHRRSLPSDTLCTLDAATTCRSGHHATVATWGSALSVSLAAAEQLSRQGVEIEVLDLVSLSPIDTKTLSESLQKTGRLVVVPPQEDPLCRRILQVGLDEAFLYLESPLRHSVADQQAVTDALLQSIHY